MSTAEILSQDEIDALLGGMSDGDIATEVDEVVDDGELRSYDFSSQDRIVRGRMPTLELVNERFARNFRGSLFNLLRRSCEVIPGEVQVLKFSEYLQSLFIPAHMNLVRCHPLQGTALFTCDPKLIFGLVDSYFGGSGRFQAKPEARDFTPSELRVVELVLERIFVDLQEAWSPVLAVEFEQIGAELNPQHANIAGPSDVVILNVFTIELAGGNGDVHVAMPYAMVEPIRALLDTGGSNDPSVHDARWTQLLRNELKRADVELVVSLAGARVSLREIIHLEPGSVVPIEMQDPVVAMVDDVPIYRGRFGASRGSLAFKVEEAVAVTPCEPASSAAELAHE